MAYELVIAWPIGDNIPYTIDAIWRDTADGSYHLMRIRSTDLPRIEPEDL